MDTRAAEICIEAQEKLIEVLQAELIELRKQNIELTAEVMHLREKAYPVIHKTNTPVSYPDPFAPYQAERISAPTLSGWNTVTLDNSGTDGWNCFAVN